MTLGFTTEFNKEVQEVYKNASAAISQSAKEGWKTAVRRTPHDTYTAQNGWKLSNSRRSSYIPKRFKQPPPRVPQFKFRITKDKRVYLYNNVPYVPYLERGEGGGIRPLPRMVEGAKATMSRELTKRLKFR